MSDNDIERQPSALPNGPVTPRTGYKRPPVAHQFQKGKSGNLRGRPKGALGKRQIVEKVLLELHEIVEGDRRVQYTALELILIAFRNKSCAGSSRAFREFEKLADKFNPQPPARRAGYLVVPERLSLELWQALYVDDHDPTQPIPGEDE